MASLLRKKANVFELKLSVPTERIRSSNIAVPPDRRFALLSCRSAQPIGATSACHYRILQFGVIVNVSIRTMCNAPASRDADQRPTDLSASDLRGPKLCTVRCRAKSFPSLQCTRPSGRFDLCDM